MQNWHNETTDALCDALLCLRTREECYAFLEDACTIKELNEIAQRFEVACLLDEKKNYQEVNKKTGASTATICRVNKCLNYGNGGYRTAIDRLKEAAE